MAEVIAREMELDSAALPDGYSWQAYFCSACGAHANIDDEYCKYCGREFVGNGEKGKKS